MATTTTKRQSKTKTARDQGVPDVYLSEKGTFRPGMDARYKSDLVHAALGLDNPKALATFDPADARKRLKQRNWLGFLPSKKTAPKAKAVK
jgi:hypothetical protein